MGADRTENVGMAHREVQRAVTSHREAADPARVPFRKSPVVLIDEGNEFPDEEILVAVLAVFGIDIKRLTSVWHDNQKFSDRSFGG
ncbi:MAG: hypothetical protein M1423_00725 [Acidobacteria bacterium]|nr:hypothetical protein [Acidobacteriota bacterium]